MLDDLVGAYGSHFLLAAGGVGLALLLLILVLWVIRSRAPSPFVRGGRNRQPRLQVLDAAAVDARRRLVLVRRDEVEHLIMRQIKTWRSAAAELQDEILGVDDGSPERCRRAGIVAVFLDGFRRLRHAERADRACRALQPMRGCADTDGFAAGNVLEA